MNTKRQRTWNPARATSLTGGVNSFSIVRSDRQSKCFSKPPSAILLRSDSRSVLASHSTRVATTRSEEHTSELQSRLHLVCRLLLEKKKHTNSTPCHINPQN